MDSDLNSFSYWNLTRSIIFRFVFAYSVLYIWPFPLYYIPFSGYIFEPIATLLGYAADVVGPLLIGETYTHVTDITGSGDSSFNYIQVFVCLVLAVTIALIWSLVDRKRFLYERLSLFLDVLVRYYLAAALFVYGFQKLIPLQFRAPTLTRLSQTYGESSPMGLLWTFMGSSELYTRFTGLGEVIAGSLLLFRKTRLLGAIIAAFVMLHVFVLNLAYDVPVKLYSFHLFFMSLILLVPSARRLVNLFLLNKPVSPEISTFQIADRKIRLVKVALKAVLIYFIFFQPMVSAVQQQRELDTIIAARSLENSLSGRYEVIKYEQKKDSIWESNMGKAQWKEMQLGGNALRITYDDGYSLSWYCNILNGSSKIRMASHDLATSGNFAFSTSVGMITLKGILNQDSIRIVSRRISDDSFLLSSHKFQWIREEPFYH